jgi:hypothetical protein
MIRLWLDDERPMPRGYNMHVRKAGLALEVIKKLKVIEVSFDHDLGGGPDGGWLAIEIEKLASGGLVESMQWHVHSANPPGKKRIEAAMQSAERFWRKDE